MEKMLLKIARQLDSLDEASLMALWSKYAMLTNRFEPTRRWEEACLILSLIQAKHWKNQLFNYCWRQQKAPLIKIQAPAETREFSFSLETPETEKSACRVLSFHQEPHEEPEGGKSGPAPE